MENEIKVNEFVRTKDGYIGKYVKDGLRKGTIEVEDNMVSWIVDSSNILKHSKNLIGLIQCGDYVNGKEVKHIADFEGINKPIKKLIFVDETHLIPGETAENEDIETVVTKEQFESISYKVERKD